MESIMEKSCLLLKCMTHDLHAKVQWAGNTHRFFQVLQILCGHFILLLIFFVATKTYEMIKQNTDLIWRSAQCNRKSFKKLEQAQRIFQKKKKMIDIWMKCEVQKLRKKKRIVFVMFSVLRDFMPDRYLATAMKLAPIVDVSKWVPKLPIV